MEGGTQEQDRERESADGEQRRRCKLSGRKTEGVGTQVKKTN